MGWSLVGLELVTDFLSPLCSLDICVTSYDALNHFETEYEDIRDMYRRITGTELCLGGSQRHNSHTSDEDWKRLQGQVMQPLGGRNNNIEGYTHGCEAEAERWRGSN